MWKAWVQSLGWEDPLEKVKKGYPLQYSGPENSMDCIVHGVAKSWTRLSLSFGAQEMINKYQLSSLTEEAPVIFKLSRIPQREALYSLLTAAAAAAKSLQSCSALCDPIDGSPSGSTVPGILQARTPEWVAISFSNA